MTPSPSIFERLEQAAKLSGKLVGKAASRTVCDAFVGERIADIRTLQQSGIPMARYARLIAPALGVKPAALLAAIERVAPLEATPKTEAAPAAPAEPVAAGESAAPAAPQSQGIAAVAPPPQQPLEICPPDQERIAPVDSAIAPAPVVRSRLHPTLPNVELPDGADWSDQMPGETDGDYIFRKALEMPPDSQRKFIGESVEERAEALLKKLDFGKGGITDEDRNILRKLVRRFGADTVDRRIASERMAHPDAKLYPSILHQRMMGAGHA